MRSEDRVLDGSARGHEGAPAGVRDGQPECLQTTQPSRIAERLTSNCLARSASEGSLSPTALSPRAGAESVLLPSRSFAESVRLSGCLTGS